MTYAGETFWYVYNAHGDVVSLTDSTGAIKARYEYDAEGRVREGFGTTKPRREWSDQDNASRRHSDWRSEGTVYVRSGGKLPWVTMTSCRL
jgi:hypothetical protein